MIATKALIIEQNLWKVKEGKARDNHLLMADQNLFRCFADSLSQIVRRRNSSAFTHKAAKIDYQQKK